MNQAELTCPPGTNQTQILPTEISNHVNQTKFTT